MTNNPEVEKWMSTLRALTLKDMASAEKHSGRLLKSIYENPYTGLGKIVEIYNQALDEANKGSEISRGYGESLCGGPSEHIPWAIYNTVGSVYHELDRKMKDLALEQLFKIFGYRRYDEVQESHTSGIREPLLLADIYIAEHLYWPGLDEGRRILEKYKDFQTLRRELIDDQGLFFHSGMKEDSLQIVSEATPELKMRSVNSDFVVAYSLLRLDFCEFGEEYVKVAHPTFLDRTLHGIVAMRFGRAETEEDIKNGIKRLEELLPKSLHLFIEPMREEGGWVDYRQFDK